MLRRELRTDESLIVRPTLEPLDLDEVKRQRRFTSTSLDTLFDLWISAARGLFEEETGRQLLLATWEYWLEGFPWARQIELPHPPLRDVLSVKYDDANGDEQTIDPDTYKAIAPSGDYAKRGFIEIKNGLMWPFAQCPASASVRIQFTAGYGDAPGDVPELFKYALMMLVGHFHKFGEEVNEARANILILPLGAQQVMDAAKFSALPQFPKPHGGVGQWDGLYQTGSSWGLGWHI